MIPYGRQSISAEDIDAVVEALKSDWLTTGPRVAAFEQAVAAYVSGQHAVAVNSGTAGLHAAMAALEIGLGDEVIVPAITFVATANAVVYQGGRPVFCDVEADTLLIDPACVETLIGPKTKAIIAVDYAGQPCNYPALRAIADRHGLALVADACHSLGAGLDGIKAGCLADMTVFSFHPVKPITTAEGGMVITGDGELARKMRVFRNHGLDMDSHQRNEANQWGYAMEQPGYNYRLSDLHCALGISQLHRLPSFLEMRRRLARRYDESFSRWKSIIPLRTRAGVEHGYHLYVVRVAGGALDRDDLFTALREEGIGVNVHYPPVHLQPFYRQHYGCKAGQCPVAESLFNEILSLPVFPDMTDAELETVVAALGRLTGEMGA